MMTLFIDPGLNPGLFYLSAVSIIAILSICTAIRNTTEWKSSPNRRMSCRVGGLEVIAS